MKLRGELAVVVVVVEKVTLVKVSQDDNILSNLRRGAT